MANRNRPAFPGPALTTENNFHPGMTMREYVAVMVLQGLLREDRTESPTVVARRAVANAEALLTELERWEP